MSLFYLFFSIGLKHDFFLLTYFPTHIRGASFLIGVIFGSIIEKNHIKNFVRSTFQSEIFRFIVFLQALKTVAWLLPVIMVGQVFGSKAFFIHNQDSFSPEFEAALLASFRAFLSLGIASAIYMCHHGMGGLINSILSFKFFIPFAKMSLSIYLVHPSYQILSTAASQSPIDFNQITMVSFESLNF